MSLVTIDINEGHFNPEAVSAISSWLESRSSWGSGKPLSEYVKDAPEGITKADLKEAFLKMKPRGTSGEDYDTRGYYLTALADKLLKDENDTIELVRPDTDMYDKFREIGHGWEKGKLILKGKFDRDTGIGGSQKGGEIEVYSNVGRHTGSLKSGGKLTVIGNTSYDAGFGMDGGEIHITGNAGANVGERMHGGEINVDGEISKPYVTGYGISNEPGIGKEKTGGKVVVSGKGY